MDNVIHRSRATDDAVEPAGLLPALRHIPLIHLLLAPLGVALLLRYRWLMDDAYVYFRYADNLIIHGSGLVYNAGEFSEGYSSPGWMLILAAARYFSGNYHLIIYSLGVVIFLLFWASLVLLNRALLPTGTPYHNLPAIYLIGNYAVLCYFTSGLETPLVQLTAVLFAASAFLPHKRWLHFALAFSPMVRPELALPLGILLIWISAHRLRDGLVMLAAILAINLGWLAFRVYYYADLFPNTFHLKNESNYIQGLKYFLDTAEPYLLIPYLIAMATMLAICLYYDRRATHYRIGARVVILLGALSVTLYVIKIGGDPRHYRYLAFPFCAVVAATTGITEHLTASASRLLSVERTRTLRRYAPLLVALGGLLTVFHFYTQSLIHAIPPWASMAIGLAVYLILADLLRITVPRRKVLLPLFLVFVISRYPWQLARNPIMGRSVHIQIDLINDAAFHRVHEVYDWKSRSLHNEALPKIRSFADYQGVYVSGICAQHFMEADLWGIHSYGLTDPFLSRANVPSDRPAHKEGLKPMAYDLLEVYSSVPPAPGMFREAVQRGIAAPWIADNLESLEALASRAYNSHNFIENLRLALAPVPRIVPPDYALPQPEEEAAPTS